jgi:hypothetical protein
MSGLASWTTSSKKEAAIVAPLGANAIAETIGLLVALA